MDKYEYLTPCIPCYSGVIVSISGTWIPPKKACGYFHLEQKRKLWLPTWIAVIQLVKKYLIWVEDGCHFYHGQYCLITKLT